MEVEMSKKSKFLDPNTHSDYERWQITSSAPFVTDIHCVKTEVSKDAIATSPELFIVAKTVEEAIKLAMYRFPPIKLAPEGSNLTNVNQYYGGFTISLYPHLQNNGGRVQSVEWGQLFESMNEFNIDMVLVRRNENEWKLLSLKEVRSRMKAYETRKKSKKPTKALTVRFMWTVDRHIYDEFVKRFPSLYFKAGIFQLNTVTKRNVTQLLADELRLYISIWGRQNLRHEPWFKELLAKWKATADKSVFHAGFDSVMASFVPWKEQKI
jgi:hypothetical protein